MTALAVVIRAISYLVGVMIVGAAIAIVVFSFTGYLW